MNQETQTPQPEPTPQNPIEEPRRIGRGAKVAMGVALAAGSLFMKATESEEPKASEQPIMVDEIGTEDVGPTEGYAGTAEDVVSQQESEEPGSLAPTDYGTPVAEGESAPLAPVAESETRASDNPSYVPGSASPGTDEGISNHPDSDEAKTPVSDETAEPTEEPLPEDPGVAPQEIEISGMEAGQEYADNMASDLTTTGRTEKVMIIDNAQFNVSEAYQQQYGITTIYRPVVTGKDTLGYFRVDQETGNVEGFVVDARHGVVASNGQEADENRFTDLMREHVDNEPYNKGGAEDYYRIVADEPDKPFVGQATGISERKGGPQPGDPEYGQDSAVKGGEATTTEEASAETAATK